MTLVELCFVMAALAILTSLAYPSWREHVRRAHLSAAAAALGEARSQMEQHFLNTRSYIDGPCTTQQTVETFAVKCLSTPTADSYTITATGSGITSGFSYATNQRGSQLTTALPADWGSVPAGGYACWVLRRGQTC